MSCFNIDNGELCSMFFFYCKQNEISLLLLCLKVLWSGKVMNPAPNDFYSQSLDALNKKLHKDQRIELCMLIIGDGLTVVIKR